MSWLNIEIPVEFSCYQENFINTTGNWQSEIFVYTIDTIPKRY